MFYFSKSKYCLLWQCPKIAWLKKHKPNEAHFDEETIKRMKEGNAVGDLAMGLFGDFVEVTANDGDKIDVSKMIENTKAEIEKGTEVICEASFDYNGLYCAVDILKKENGGFAIYEVKSSTKGKDKKDDKPVYIADIAYQKYVLEHCGVNVTGTYLVCLNKDFVFDGNLDLSKLFIISDVSSEIAKEEKSILNNLSVAEKLLSSPNEPDIDIHKNCKNPYLCSYWKYCSKHLPKPSVFDLYSMNFSKKIEHYNEGRIEYETLEKSGKIKSEKQLRQMSHYLTKQDDYIDKDNLKDFLDTITYPVYFLDFESVQPVIPEYIGTHPYAQIPFQYSLHYIEKKNGELKHKEFLAESGTDPRRAIAERLCEDIPEDVSVLAYNKSFECTRLKELAEYFPDLSQHLLNIESNIIDLLVPFQKGYYYNKDMGGTFSIKSVLPALFPDDPSLNYHNLEDIHNGTEAMTIFPLIKDMPKDEADKTINNLLKYCELDTFALVKVWQKLNDSLNN